MIMFDFRIFFYHILLKYATLFRLKIFWAHLASSYSNRIARIQLEENSNCSENKKNDNADYISSHMSSRSRQFFCFHFSSNTLRWHSFGHFRSGFEEKWMVKLTSSWLLWASWFRLICRTYIMHIIRLLFCLKPSNLFPFRVRLNGLFCVSRHFWSYNKRIVKNTKRNVFVFTVCDDRKGQ